MAKAEISMNDISKRLFVEIRVTGMTVFRFRKWCAIQLIKLAGVIMPANVNIEVEC